MSGDLKAALTREYPVGTVVFEEGDPGSRMYVIRKGRVKIYRKHGEQEVVLAFLSTGDFFGEMALLESLPRSATAMVVEPSVLVEVDSETFESMIRRNIEIAVRMMRRLASRVRELDTRLERLMVDNAQGRALEVIRWLMPQGTPEGEWIRITGAAAHFDLGAQAGLSPAQATSVFDSLTRAGCVKSSGDDLLVAHTEVLDAYGAYLDLRRKYADAKTPKAEPSGHGSAAIKRLMHALQLPSAEVEERQQQLAEQYERYSELHQRFGDMESEE